MAATRAYPPSLGEREGTSEKPDFLSIAAEREPGEVVGEFSTEINAALERPAKDELDVAWIQGQSCTGCTISLLQGDYPEGDIDLQEFRKSIAFHPTLMADAGESAIDAIGSAPDILIVEGAIPTEVPRSATLGPERRPILDWVVGLAGRADFVVAVGNCAAYGGLPAAGRHDPDAVGISPTGATGLQFDGTDPGGVLGPAFTSDRSLPVVNVSGCPTHPDYVLLTLATVLNGHEPRLDVYNRPLPFFEPLVHDNCYLREDYEKGNFASGPGEEGCLYEAGCAGVYANSDCSSRLRNGETAMCRSVGAPCIGCVEPAFWDRFTPFYEPRETKVGRETGDSSEPSRAIEAASEVVPGSGRNVARLLLALPILVLLLPLLPIIGVLWLLKRAFGSDEPTAWRSDPRSRSAGKQ